jgi:hypothetical protein
LIELLAALLITGFVVTVASRIFLSGNAQFVKRSADSDRLNARYRLKAQLRNAFLQEAVRCEGGRLTLKGPEGDFDLLGHLRKRDEGVVEAAFKCLEADAGGGALQAWREADQPPLIEYRLILKIRGGSDTLDGSWLR